jgi:hypothetical protein
MKLAAIFKEGPPFADTRRKLRAAIETDKITEDANAATGLSHILDSLDMVESVMAIEEAGRENNLSASTVRDLLWRLDRLDEEYELRQRK